MNRFLKVASVIAVVLLVSQAVDNRGASNLGESNIPGTGGSDLDGDANSDGSVWGGVINDPPTVSDLFGWLAYRGARLWYFGDWRSDAEKRGQR